MRDDYKFRHTFSSDVAKFLKASSGQVVMMHPEKFRSKHEPESRSLAIKVQYSHNISYAFHSVQGSLNCSYTSDMSLQDSTSASEIQDFFKKNVLPLVGHRKQSNDAKRYTKRPLVVVYYGVDFSFDYRVGKCDMITSILYSPCGIAEMRK